MTSLDVAERHLDLETAETNDWVPTQTVEDATPRRSSRRIDISLLLAGAVLIIVLLFAVAPQLFTAYDPIKGLPGQQLKPPSAAHLLGTDSLGRDLYARLVYGAVHSLSGALAAVGIGLFQRQF
jgi:peptide/nickel transport system permease protein